MNTFATFERSSDGQLVVPLRLIYGAEAYAQRLRHRFRMFKGEWFLDIRQGLPYYDYILVKDPNMRVVTSILRRVIETTPGTKAIRNMNVDLDATARRASVSDLEIELTDGETFYSQADTFILQLPIGKG